MIKEDVHLMLPCNGTTETNVCQYQRRTDQPSFELTCSRAKNEIVVSGNVDRVSRDVAVTHRSLNF